MVIICPTKGEKGRERKEGERRQRYDWWGSSLVHGSDYLIQKFPGYPLISRGLYGLSRTQTNELTLDNECDLTLVCIADVLAWTGLDLG